MIAREIEHRLGRRKPLRRYALDDTVDPLIGQRQLDIDSLPFAMRGHQLAQRLHQSKQLGHEDMAFAHIDDAVRAAFVKAQHRAFRGSQSMQRRTAA